MGGKELHEGSMEERKPGSFDLEKFHNARVEYPMREASTFLQEMNEMLPWSEDKTTIPAQVYEMELNQNSLPDNKVYIQCCRLDGPEIKSE